MTASTERAAAAKLRRDIYLAAGVEPCTPVRGVDVPRYEQAARAAGVLHQRARYELARRVGFTSSMRAERSTSEQGDRYYFEGVASTTDTPYEMYDSSGPYLETIDHRAFDKTLANDPDVAFLMNHGGITMARTANGTLKLGMVDKGLGVEAWLNPKRSDVNDMVIGLDDGDLTEMSFAFMLDEGEWDEDFENFRITQVDLHRGDVSVVNYGANPYTSVGARQQEIMAALRRLPTGAARAAQTILSGRADVAELAKRIHAMEIVDADPEIVEAPKGRSVALLRAQLDLSELS